MSGPELHWLADLETFIATREAELVELRSAAATVRRMVGTVVPTARTPAAERSPRQARRSAPTVKRATREPKTRRAQVDTGALEADVLKALQKLRRPAKGREVLDHVPGVDKSQVVATLRALVKTKQVVRSGATISLRYALPEFAET